MVSQSQASLAASQATLAAEQDNLSLLLAGNPVQQIQAAAAQVAAAKAQAQAAASQVAEAQAQVALLDKQIARMSILSPSEGVILSRSGEPGEMALPGGALIMGDLGKLTLTVYLPENEYGVVRIGDGRA